MTSSHDLDAMERSFEKSDETSLGPLKNLKGVWENLPGIPGRGWNMIALPFISSTSQIDYRILMNQYNEVFNVDFVDEGVPNRGVIRPLDENLNQKIVTVDYQQTIRQIAADDMPKSELAGGKGLPIHHEPGLWLNMLNLDTAGFNIARLGNVPHGNAFLALGKSDVINGPPSIPDVDVLPTGATRNINSGYLQPYKFFRDNPFEGLFNVLEPHTLLRAATPQNVKQTNILHVDSNNLSGGIQNIPFIVRHANATEVNSTFWIMELEDEFEADGSPVFILQYMQVVMLEFFERFDGVPGDIKWPHVSFNTMRRAHGQNQETLLKEAIERLNNT